MKKLLLLVCCVTMCSCSVFGREHHPRYIKVPLNIPNPAAVKMRPVKFKVVHKDNAGAVFSDLEKKKQEPVLFGLTGTDYKNLATNIQALKAYIVAQRKVIELYREYYEGNND